MDLRVIDVSELMSRVGGATISGGEISEDGFHLFLNDGRVLLFVGDFLISIYQRDTRILQ